MADDKHFDSVDESDESTPLPTGAELADEDLTVNRKDLAGQPGGAHAADTPGVHADEADVSEATEPELTEDAEIVDDQPGDGYADDPATEDINEAKLDRATDAAAGEATVGAGSTTQRRPRSARPVRRRSDAGSGPEATAAGRTASAGTVSVAGDEDGDEAAALEPTPATGRRRTVARKDRRTPEQGAADGRRTGPVQFVNESVGELRKVVWPTANQVQQYFIVVLVFVLFIIAFVSLLDLGLGWALLKVFG